MSKSSIYLFGRTLLLNYEDAIGWRQEATKALCPWFHVLNPMRGKEALKATQTITGAYPEYPNCSAKEIVQRDELDLQRCDAGLGYSTLSTRPGKSSWIEVGCLWALKKPIILIVDPHDTELRTNSFLSEMPGLTFADTLSQGIARILTLFNL